jgi:putative hydrolase of the HAD superfamily
VSRIHLTGIRTVVFDLDDTLCAERDYAFSGFDAVGRWLSQRMECPFDPAARMRELFDSQYRRRVFDRLLDETGCTDPHSLVPEMIACYRKHLPDITLLPDANRALTRWQGQFFLGLISDGPLVMQENKVAALGLRDRLDAVVLTDVWGQEYWKPHERAFEVLETSSGQSGAACVYIADNAAKDFVAPVRRGWRTLRICRAGGTYASVQAHPGGRAEFDTDTLDQVDLSS